MRVGIVGCGYVGLALAGQLVDGGHSVWGLRRSEAGLDAVAATGAKPVAADLTKPEDLATAPDADAVVFAASSGGRGADAARKVYVDGLQATIDEFAARDAPPERLVYTSSTGVYGTQDGGWVDEATPIEPTTEKTRVLADAERVAREYAAETGLTGQVARFAGLYGPDRYRLDRYLEGPVTEGYLNMIHRADAAGVVRFLLERPPDNGVVLVVDDEPVDKWTFADWLADACGVDRPETRTKAERLKDADLSDPARRRILTSKRCSNALLRELGYEYRYPTFREGYRPAVRAYRAGR